METVEPSDKFVSVGKSYWEGTGGERWAEREIRERRRRKGRDKY